MTARDMVKVIVCFAPEAGAGACRRALEALGLSEEPDPRWRLFEPGLLVTQVSTRSREAALDRLRTMSDVRRVVDLPASQWLYERADRGPVFLSNGTRIGGGAVSVIAGPCSVEGEQQVCEIAEQVKESGAQALRGGVFKPRTSPYAFGGLGEKGLEYLALARERTGLPVVTEALDTTQVELVAHYADVIQIGSRNMQNFHLLVEAGRRSVGKAVLLKRGLAATIDEFLQAAEYVLLGRLWAGASGPGVILCERGIRTFENETRFTLDVGAIPVLKERAPLPVLADPSHAAGQRRYVRPLAGAAVAAGADGLLVEVHTAPDGAWSDSAQCLGTEDFRELMGDVRRLAPVRPYGIRCDRAPTRV